ncbi:MAG: hypothetical protein ACYC1D_13735, partial [Acidimicrobiales bacterium]
MTRPPIRSPAVHAAVVQFPHPGAEHPAGLDDEGRWNTGDHRRKFLLATGAWHDGDRPAGEGPLTFWGEWEPRSEIVARRSSPAPAGFPRFLRRPLWTYWDGTGNRQNTDPLVLGGFSYTNCRQDATPSCAPFPPGPWSCSDPASPTTSCWTPASWSPPASTTTPTT